MITEEEFGERYPTRRTWTTRELEKRPVTLDYPFVSIEGSKEYFVGVINNEPVWARDLDRSWRREKDNEILTWEEILYDLTHLQQIEGLTLQGTGTYQDKGVYWNPKDKTWRFQNNRHIEFPDTPESKESVREVEQGLERVEEVLSSLSAKLTPVAEPTTLPGTLPETPQRTTKPT